MYGRQLMREHEVNLISADFEAILAAPEATNFTLEYYTWVDPGDPDNYDDVYGVNDRPVANVPHEYGITGLHEIVSENSLDLIQSGILEVGDSVLYISKNVNLQEPDAGFPVVAGSLIFVGPDSNRWEPKIQVLAEAQDYLCTRVGNAQICQAIPLQPEKK